MVRSLHYIVVFISGAVLMALEIVGSRVLAPHFGSSIFVWGSLISVVMAALSAGYYWGGWLSAREPSYGRLLLLLLIPGVLIFALPFVYPAVNEWVVGADLGIRLSPLIACSIYFLPPGIFLGTISLQADSERNLILVAHDLSPADVVQFKQHRFASFITDLGGTTSHTAVVARSLAIPSIVALHRAWQMIREHEIVIVDGTQGVVIVDPDERVLAEYQRLQQQFDLERQKLRRLKDRRAVTLDGVEVELQANIELPGDVSQARANGATGIGLFRSEFLFLNRDDLPDEDEQFEAYRKVAADMEGMPVTIRTYDLGADKDHELKRVITNPALGLRAIRLCLTEPQRFITQLRALLRASHYGKINILIPMLATAAEIDQTLELIRLARASLDEEGTPYDHDIKVGGMIEVPAAALAVGMFIRKLDFLSIGTNDLIQYTLAIDRTDDTVAHLYDPLHPAVLNLLAGVIRTADRAKVPVALCGEMAGDVALTRLLLAFGLRAYSMHIAHLLDVKQVILRSKLSQLRPLAQKMLRASDPEKLLALLDKLNSG